MRSLEEIRYKSYNGENTVVAFLLTPDEDVLPRGVIQLVHGMAEHIDRYMPFAEFLADNGFIVCGHDHVGHGKSSPSKEDYGYFGAAKPGEETLIEDIRYLQVVISRKYRPLPYFLFGHSMGSLAARYYTSKYGGNLDGLVICGTSDEVGPFGIVQKAGKALLEANIKKNGDRFVNLQMDKMIFGGYNKKIKPAKTKSDWLSRDEKSVAEYINDPMDGFIFTNNGFKTLLNLIEKVSAKECFANTPKKLPILIISGDADPVGAYGKGVISVYSKYRSAGIEDVKIHLYPGARHELLQETNKAEVFADVLAFFEGIN